MTYLEALLIVMSIALTMTTVAAAQPITFYVSTKGNDAWSGQLPEPNAANTDGPFATFQRARDAIRQIKATEGLARPIDIQVRQGTYHLSEPLRLGPEDSGTEQCPVRYMAYPGEQPVLSGGQQVTGWRRYKGQIMRAQVPELIKGERKFRQLFFNGQRQICARYPNYAPDDPLYGGWAFMEAVFGQEGQRRSAFKYDSAFSPQRWAKPEQGEVFFFPWLCWVNAIVPIESIDYEQGIIKLDIAGRYWCGELTVGNRFYVQNILEELDQPGEWCSDSETGTIYFWPPEPGLEDAEVTVPVTDRLMELQGTSNEPVKHVTISGFTFTQTLALFPPQNVFCNQPNTEGYALYLENTEHCHIAGNLFDSVGGDAIRLQNRNSYNHIENNTIVGAGAQGVVLANERRDLSFPQTWRGQSERLRELADSLPRATGNIITGNHIHHCGVIEKFGAAIKVYGLACQDNIISHNLIHDMPHAGIATVLGFGRNIIEYNELRHLCLEMADTGGFYSNRWFVVEGDEVLGEGQIIRYNLVEDMVGCGAYDAPHGRVEGAVAGGRIWTPYYTWGIYFDNSPMHATVYGNIIVGNTRGGVGMPVADPKDNLIENNILADSRQQYLTMNTGNAVGNRIVRNIFYRNDPNGAWAMLFHGWNANAVTDSDYNLFYAPNGAEPVIGAPGLTPDQSFAQWRAQGFDTHSLLADPLFVDPKGGDFRLQPDSPALELGFQPIPVNKIGLPKPGDDSD